MNEKKQNPNDGARKRLAENIYVGLVGSLRANQFNKEQLAKEAREAAEAFYPDEETPTPSIPMNKAM